VIIVIIDDGWKVCANSPLLIAWPWIIWIEYYPYTVCSVYLPVFIYVYVCELDCHGFLFLIDWYRVGKNGRESLAG